MERLVVACSDVQGMVELALLLSVLFVTLH